MWLPDDDAFHQQIQSHRVAFPQPIRKKHAGERFEDGRIIDERICQPRKCVLVLSRDRNTGFLHFAW